VPIPGKQCDQSWPGALYQFWENSVITAGPDPPQWAPSVNSIYSLAILTDLGWENMRKPGR